MLRNISTEIAQDLEYARSLALANSLDTEIVFSNSGYICLQQKSILFERRNDIKQVSFNNIRLAIKGNGNPKYAGTVYIRWRGVSSYKVTLPPGAGIINVTKL